jgi:hypothetical protein
MVFAKLKTMLRKTAAWTRNQLCAAIGDLLPILSAVECASYLRHCGYDAT